jgi:hypothetical protein
MDPDLETNRSSIGTACPHPRETMACPGGWAKDSYRFIHNVCAMACDVRPINNRPAIRLKLVFFIITSLYS